MVLSEILANSKELKRLIVKRSEQFNLPIRYACDEVGISYREFMQGYINSGTSNGFDINEKQFLELLRLFGVTVRYNFIVAPDEQMSREAEELIAKYEAKAQEELNKNRKYDE